MRIKSFPTLQITLALVVAVGLPGLPLGGTATAASASGGYAVRGIGAQKCSDLTAALGTDGSDAAIQNTAAWAAGYISQFNRSAADTYDSLPIIDNLVVARLAASICKSNQDALVETIMANLITSFAPSAVPGESALVKIVDNGKSATLRSGVFLKVQEKLIAGGFLVAGAGDGQYGPRSREALLAFQKVRGISLTGLPDPATLILLFVSDGNASALGQGN